MAGTSTRKRSTAGRPCRELRRSGCGERYSLDQDSAARARVADAARRDGITRLTCEVRGPPHADETALFRAQPPCQQRVRAPPPSSPILCAVLTARLPRAGARCSSARCTPRTPPPTLEGGRLGTAVPTSAPAGAPQPAPPPASRAAPRRPRPARAAVGPSLRARLPPAAARLHVHMSLPLARRDTGSAGAAVPLHVDV